MGVMFQCQVPDFDGGIVVIKEGVFVRRNRASKCLGDGGNIPQVSQENGSLYYIWDHAINLRLLDIT